MLSGKLILTDLVLDLICHTWYFKEQTQRLIHPLVDHTEVSQNLTVRIKDRSLIPSFIFQLNKHSLFSKTLEGVL